MNVTYWSDYACPFCYIGVTHLERAIENLGVTGQVKVTMRAFELDSRAPKTCDSDTTERFGAKYGLSAAQAAERVAEITDLAHEAGLAGFDYAATRSTNTFDEDARKAFVGDTIQRGGIGTWEYPGGNRDEFERSIYRILDLPESTKLLSGHSNPWTVGEARAQLLG